MIFSPTLEENGSIKGTVLDKISYEVKESLTSIIGFSNIIKNSCLDPKQIEQIDNVLISSEKLLEFANNISGFSKLMTGEYETNHYTFSTEKLLSEIAHSFVPIIQKKKINFHQKISEVKITNDYQLTSQIIYSLINYLMKLSCENSSIFLQNTSTKDGVLIEIETDIIGFLNPQKAQSLNEVSDFQDLEFNLTKHLIDLTEGKILFSKSENNDSKIQVYIPNKSALILMN